MRSTVRWAGGAVLLGAVIGLAATPPVGSTIEVREGDTWSKVKVIAAEGTRVQVEYDDGTKEWVGKDRMKPSAGGGAAPVPSPTPAPTDSAPASPAGHAGLAVDDAVQVKRSNEWRAAHLRQISPNWLFVQEDEKQDETRWVEPWTVRVVGSNYDFEAEGAQSWTASAGQLPPHEPPKPAPRSVGNRLAVAPGGAAASISFEDLKKTFDTVSFDNAQSPQPADAPVQVPTTRPSADFAAWAVRGSENRLTAILPPLGQVKTAVAAFDGEWGRWTTIIRCNLRAHSQMDTRAIRVPNLHVQSAGEEGDVVLTTCEWDQFLQVWRWDGKAYQLSANLKFGDRANITQATVLSVDRAMVAIRPGSVLLLDLKAKQVLASCEITPNSCVYVHPSGQLLGVVSGDKALLLRANDFARLGEFDDASPNANITVDPAGKLIAYLTNDGPVRVAQIADNTQVGQVAVGGSFHGQLDLVDNQFILVNGDTAYEIKSGIPVWHYRMPMGTYVRQVMAGQFLLASWGDNTASVALASIPDAAGRAALKSAATTSFILRPGTAVKIDGDLGAFGNDRDKANAAVAAAVASAGLLVSDKDEPFHLTVGVAGGPSVKRDYAPDMFTPPNERIVSTVDVPSNVFTASLNYKGESVWKQEIRFVAGSFLQRDKDHSFQDAANDAARPTAERIKGLTIPSYLPAGATPGAPVALGASTLKGTQFVPDKPDKAAGRSNGARPK